MKRSTDRILTTHTGSLPRESEIADLLVAREKGDPLDAERLEDASRRAVRECVDRQLATGLDIINDGEQSKPSYATYIIDRLTGFEGGRRRSFPRRLDSADFPEWARLKAPRGLAALRVPECTGPIAWKDFDAVRIELDHMRAAVADKPVEEVFLSAASPGVIANMLPNAHYASDEEYLQAMADVMRDEYEAIIAAGFLLQVDCAMDRHEARTQFFDGLVQQHVHLHQIALHFGQMLVAVFRHPRQQVHHLRTQPFAR